MKILALVITAVLFLTGCTNYKKAIAEVIQQRAAARQAAVVTITIGRRTGLEFSSQKYLIALQNIDATKCPPDFLSAWTGYIAAWDRKMHFNRQTAEEDASALAQIRTSGNIQVGASPGIGGSIDATQAGREEENRLLARDNNEQWLKCRKLATEKYGVFVPPDPF